MTSAVPVVEKDQQQNQLKIFRIEENARLTHTV